MLFPGVILLTPMCLVLLPRCHLDFRLPPRLILTRATTIPCFALKPSDLARSSLVGCSTLVTKGSRLHTCILSHNNSPTSDSSGFLHASLIYAYIDFIVFSFFSFTVQPYKATSLRDSHRNGAHPTNSFVNKSLKCCQ